MFKAFETNIDSLPKKALLFFAFCLRLPLLFSSKEPLTVCLAKIKGPKDENKKLKGHNNMGI
jgi:hypothetical protein